jgi:hypothetical protein
MLKPIASLCAIALFGWAPLATADTSSLPVPLVSPGSPDQRPKHRASANDTGTALPQAGDVELLLEAPPIINSTNLTPGTTTRGLGVTSSSQPGGETYFGLGLNAGAGYYVTDLFEIGGAVAFDYGQCLAGGTSFGNGNCANGGYFEAVVEPFVKLNFGRLLQGAHFNPFAQLGIIVGGETGPGVSTGLLGFDIDLGVDFLISRGWGIAVFIPFSLVAPLANNASVPTVFGFGFGYGLVTYF